MARRKGRLAAKGFVLTDPIARRYTDPSGKEVSYREAFIRATGRSLERASAAHAGKFSRTTEVAREIRNAARDGSLAEAHLLTKTQERRLGKRSLKSLMRGHTFRSALRRGVSTASSAGLSAVERRSPYGKLLGILHEGESGVGFRRRKGETREHYRQRTVGFRDERQRMKEVAPAKYRRLFGPKSAKARLLVAMGRREASATYDVGETP